MYKKDSSPRTINYEYNMIKKNHLHQIDDLFSTYLSFISHPQDDEDLDVEVSQLYIL